eukprot:CAMPEP_0185257782 /NCGR_PEP_ID=MMETSP1359-20130426/6804_1 /TAXON_ID=552665 /ORGANISM="Bigelowiella longifila, Strain CCMP242" /LENGTH=237 /DNA_ID=CAMNT_0027843017 /DNA_START=74 /DNA_END=788 /DNA_ORIENTATION=+
MLEETSTEEGIAILTAILPSSSLSSSNIAPKGKRLNAHAKSRINSCKNNNNEKNNRGRNQGGTDSHSNRRNSSKSLRVRFLRKVILFLMDAHALLRGLYVFCLLHIDDNGDSEQELLQVEGKKGENIGKDDIYGMYKDIQVAEFFVEMLDNIFLQMPGASSRSRRDKDQIITLIRLVKEATSKAAQHVVSITLHGASTIAQVMSGNKVSPTGPKAMSKTSLQGKSELTGETLASSDI